MKALKTSAACLTLGTFALLLPVCTGRHGATPAATARAAEPKWTLPQAVTSTARQAWVLGGKTEDGFIQITEALADLSIKNRGETVPNTKEAGKEVGQLIIKECKADPDDLLYAIVDRAICKVAKKK